MTGLLYLYSVSPHVTTTCTYVPGCTVCTSVNVCMSMHTVCTVRTYVCVCVLEEHCKFVVDVYVHLHQVNPQSNANPISLNICTYVYLCTHTVSYVHTYVCAQREFLLIHNWYHFSVQIHLYTYKHRMIE